MRHGTNGKSEMLPPEYVIIRGRQGAGKTSLATAMISTDYKYHREERRQLAVERADELREMGGKKLHIPDHLYFSNFPILLDRRKRVYTHCVDISQLALPNEQFSVQYFPYGSVIVIQEADMQLLARDWSETNNYIVDFLKLFRHNGLTVLFDVQSDGLLDKSVRRLATELYHVERLTRRRFLWFRPRLEWDYIAIANQTNQAAKEMAEIGRAVPSWQLSRKCRFRFKGDVFRLYDSFSGLPYFLRGITDYNVQAHSQYDFSAEGIEAFCKRYPLEKPVETIKQKRKQP